jgi:Hydrogenase 4 membrane component (E)
MVLNFLLSGFLISAFLMTIAKRVTALTRTFRLQSLFLFLYTLTMAATQKHNELYIISASILILKVGIIPYVLSRIVRRIHAEENLGLVVNPQLSLVVALLLAYLSYVFTDRIMSFNESLGSNVFAVSITIICIGFFIMVSRMKALGQVLGFLVMENGIFLAAAAITGGMPFLLKSGFSLIFSFL